jgi:hypothetical protein
VVHLLNRVVHLLNRVVHLLNRVVGQRPQCKFAHLGV